jgi:hydrogenase expression/formation protein HypE
MITMEARRMSLAIRKVVKIDESLCDGCGQCIPSCVEGALKVIDGKAGLYINTSGIGILETPSDISVQNAVPGDAVIISGHMGNHHACILSCRMGIENGIQSDCAPLGEMVEALLKNGLQVHTLRDVTRGGLGTVLHEIAMASRVGIALDGAAQLADERVLGFCDILGLDPLYMGNEGKLALVLPGEQAEAAVKIIRGCRYGEFARIIGHVQDAAKPAVTMKTRAGGTRLVEPLLGEGLPRIC